MQYEKRQSLVMGKVIVENTFYLYKKMIHVMSLFKSPTATTILLGVKNYYGNGFTDYE